MAGAAKRKRDVEGSGESGEGSSTVLYIVPGGQEAVWRAGRARLHGATHTYSDSPDYRRLAPQSKALSELFNYCKVTRLRREEIGDERVSAETAANGTKTKSR